MTIRKAMLLGGSASAIFAATIGPRIYLAPDDGAGGGAAPAGDGGGSGGGDAGGGAASGEPAAPSLLGDAVKAAADAKPAGDGAATGDQKPAEGDKPAGDKPAPKDSEKPIEAADAVVKDVDGNPLPEAYEIKAPDGVEIDKALLEKVAPRFKEAKMSPAQAQLAADVYSDIQKEQLENHIKTVEGWQKRSKSDPEIGGANFDKNLGRASEAFRAFGDEETMQVIDTYGLGNHPGILRMFTRIGNAISEGGTVLAGGGAGRVSDAQALYPNMNK